MLCEAHHDVVVNDSISWREYDQQSPKVCFGNIYQAVKQLSSMPGISKCTITQSPLLIS